MSKNYDQIRTSSPLSTLDGTETFTVNQSGVTKGGFLSLLKTFIKSGFVAADVTNSTSTGRDVLTAANAAAGRTALGAQATLTVVDQATAEAGVSTTLLGWTSQRVRQAIAAYSDPKRLPSLVVTASGTANNTYTNRTVIASASGAITIGLPTSGSDFSSTDVLVIANLGTAPVTIDGASSITQKGTGVVTSYSLAVNGIVRLYNLGGYNWFLEG